MNNKTLTIDSRQQKNRHTLKHDHFARMGIKSVRSKLVVGDYMYIGGTVSVDTKRDVAELWSNIRSSQHDRFVAECRLARDIGVTLVILVENEHGIASLNDLAEWVEPVDDWRRRSKKAQRIYGVTLAKACNTIHDHYGTMFGFCSPIEAGQKVLDILDYYEVGGE